MKTVMRTVSSKSNKPVRAVVQGTRNPWVEVELRDLKAGQMHLLKLLHHWAVRNRYRMGAVEAAEPSGSGHRLRRLIGTRRKTEQERWKNGGEAKSM